MRRWKFPKRMTTWGIAAGASAAALALCAAPARAGTVIDANLGPALGYAVVGLQGDTGSLNMLYYGAFVNGDVAVGPNVNLNNAAPSEITGTTFVDSGGTVTGTGLFDGGIVTGQDLSGAVTAAKTASTTFLGFSPDMLSGSVVMATTFTRTDSLTVINLNGDINLNNENLTLSGGPTDEFIINVSGALNLAGDASIVLSGGLLSQNVVLNFWDGLNGFPTLTTDANTTVNGIVLAPHRNGTLFGTWNGEVIFGYSNVVLLPGVTVNGETAPPAPPVVPLPSTAMSLFALAGAGLMSQLLRRVRG